MDHIVVAGTNDLARYYVDVIHTYSEMKIVAILQTENAKLSADSLGDIPVFNNVEAIKEEQIDYIFWCETDRKLSEIKQYFHSNPILLTQKQLQVLKPFVESFIQQFSNMELILNSIRDGLIVVDEHAQVKFMNKTAKNILEIAPESDIQLPITELIPDSRLPKVLQHQEKEINQRLSLKNGGQIITTRIPLVNNRQHLIGAFAIFKDSNEILRLAEENTDLKEVKTMLEAIIHSSDEAISVVNEHGNGMMINPAYTRITGLSETDVISKPATVDIYEGKSMHMQVLETRRPVRGAKLKVGPQKKEVLVNASPIIVQGKLKGSVAVIHDISENKALTKALKHAKQIIRNLEATYTFGDIIGSSAGMMIAIEQAKIGARTPETVLLKGESGVGKGLFARAIHNESERKYNKFIRVNCAALDETFLESELFGYEEGVFTGTKTGRKKGLFEEADKGSIFLDEVGELSLHMQVRLLHVLQKKEVIRVGGTIPVPLDIHVIAATNKNLEKAATNKTFLEGLYNHLNRLPIYIPPLKDRIDDLPDLVHHMIMKVNQRYGRNVSSVSPAAMEKLRHYHWPGNIRELENVISGAVIFMGIAEKIIEYYHFPELTVTKSASPQMPANTKQTLQQATDAFEKNFIYRVYKKNGFNKTKTAEVLGISVRNLYYKLEKYT